MLKFKIIIPLLLIAVLVISTYSAVDDSESISTNDSPDKHSGIWHL